MFLNDLFLQLKIFVLFLSCSHCFCLKFGVFYNSKYLFYFLFSLRWYLLIEMITHEVVKLYMHQVFSNCTKMLHFLKDFFIIVANYNHIDGYFIFMNPFIRYIHIAIFSLIHKDAFNIDSHLSSEICVFW